MDLFIRTLSLVSKLIAREVQDLKALILVCGINALKVLILWSKAAASCSVDNQKDLFRQKRQEVREPSRSSYAERFK